MADGAGDDSLVEELARSALMGARVMLAMTRTTGQAAFGDWSSALKKELRLDAGEYTEATLSWLWTTLCQAPALRRQEGIELVAGGPRQLSLPLARTATPPPVQVLDKDSKLVFDLNLNLENAERTDVGAIHRDP